MRFASLQTRLQTVYHHCCKLCRTHKGNVRSIPPAFPRKFLRVKLVRTPRLLREMHRPLTVAGLRWFSGTVCRRDSRRSCAGSKGCYLFWQDIVPLSGRVCRQHEVQGRGLFVRRQQAAALRHPLHADDGRQRSCAGHQALMQPDASPTVEAGSGALPGLLQDSTHRGRMQYTSQ